MSSRSPSASGAVWWEPYPDCIPPAQTVEWLEEGGRILGCMEGLRADAQVRALQTNRQTSAATATMVGVRRYDGGRDVSRPYDNTTIGG